MSLLYKLLVFSQNKKMSRIKKRKQFHREKHILLESNQLGKNIVEGNIKKTNFVSTKALEKQIAELNFAGKM